MLLGAVPAAARTREAPLGPGLRSEPLLWEAIEDGRQRVRYYSSTPDFMLFLTDSGATLVFPTRVIRIALGASNPGAAIEGEPAASGPFVGGGQGRAPAKIRSYRRVRYRDIYPGIDLVFRGDERHIEHDFVVAPGAEPARIHLRFHGADRLFIDAEGSLVVRAGEIELSISPPRAYQEPEAASTPDRIPVEAYYVLTSETEVGFRLGPYDRRRTLTIDPIFRVRAARGNPDGCGLRR
jgi:hypothetical protein